MEINKIYQAFLLTSGICTDTRKIKSDSMFFALKGENFNGNKYAEKALANGALYAVVDDPEVVLSSQYILVSDVLECLQGLASFHRLQFKGTVIALTGSNGKTTCKELIAAVLKSKFQITCTIGNLNNHIGVPLTLLSASVDDDFIIVEMGANHQLEIEALCNIAHPDFGLITNIGKAHLEGFGGVEGVIKGKYEMYHYLKSNDRSVFANQDDALLVSLLDNYQKVVFYNKEGKTQNRGEFYLKFQYKGEIFDTHLIGDFQLENISLAIAIGEYFNVGIVEISKAINNYIPSNNRSQIIKQSGVDFILDAYNANPTSMRASIIAFKSLDYKNKCFVIGDMLELGTYAHKEHLEIAQMFDESELDSVVFIGAVFKHVLNTNMYKVYSSVIDAKPQIKNLIQLADALLLKGSRGLRLEEVLDLNKG